MNNQRNILLLRNFKADSLHWYSDDHLNEILFPITFDVFINSWSSNNYIIIMDDYTKWVNSAAVLDSTESGHVNTGGIMSQITR